MPGTFAVNEISRSQPLPLAIPMPTSTALKAVTKRRILSNEGQLDGIRSRVPSKQIPQSRQVFT